MYLILADFFENGFLGKYSDLFGYYGRTLRKWNDFSGRTGLHEFWLSNVVSGLCISVLMLIVLIVSSLISGIFSLSNNDLVSNIGSLIGFLLYFGSIIFLMIPMLALTIRRLHDVNKSAWWLLTILCCGIGGIIITIFILGNSVENGNKFTNNFDGQTQKMNNIPSQTQPISNNQDDESIDFS